MNSKNSYSIPQVRLSYVNEQPVSQRKKVISASQSYDVLYDLWDKETIDHHECFKVLLLNRSNTILGLANISEGGISGTVTDVRIILQHAILSNASAIILSHNHPSGNLEPSQPDIDITNKIKEACKFFDISILDHIILANSTYFSMSDNGLI